MLSGFAATALVLLVSPGVSFAQEQPAEQQAEQEEIEEVVVTGSRISRKELEVAAPVTIYTQADIQRTGVTSIGQLLREMPAVHGQAQTTQANNGGDGTMKISLRGLGAVRTLVLLNGRRLVPTVDEGANSIAVDSNTIPIAMIERVEVLKDGASAIYGSDAVAGVVNLITRVGFEGIEVSGLYGDSSDGGGERQELSLVTGGTGDANWTFYAQYVNEKEIEVKDRRWADKPWELCSDGAGRNCLDGGVNTNLVIGSSAPPWGRYRGFSDEEGLDCGTDCTLGPEFGSAFRPFSFFGGDSYNFAPANFQRVPNERWQFGLFADTAIESVSRWGFLGDVEFFIEASYTDRESSLALAEVPLAPLAFFGFPAPYSADNFYNQPENGGLGVEIPDWRRRMVEGDRRTESHDEDVIRALFGFRGEWGQGSGGNLLGGLLDGWGWEFTYIRGESEREQHFGDVYNLQRVANAVGPTTGSLATGDLACVNDPDNCVPLDTFGPGSVTSEMLDYLTFTTNESFEAEQDIVEVVFRNSALLELPAGPLGFAFGYQFREETGQDNPDSQVAALGDAATGTPRQPTGGRFDVNSWYGELVIPLLADMPFAQSLELEVAVRHSDYNTFGTTTDPKFGVTWRPFDDLLIRGTQSDAFRAPNVGELFGGAGFSFPSLTDPCSAGRGLKPGPDGELGTGDDFVAVCMDPRVPDEGFIPISTQVKETQGGNSTIDAETADLVTLGFVYTPSFLEGISLAVDFYEGEVEEAVAVLGSDFILTACQQRGEFCDKVDRFTEEGLQGQVRNIDNRFTNVGGVDARGVDFALRYRGLQDPLLGGSADVRIDVSWTQEHDVIQADGTKIEHAGWLRDEQDGHFADWQAVLGLDYYTENFRFSWDTRIIDDVKELADDFGTGNKVERTVHGRTYHDFQSAYDFELGGIDHTVMLGVDNVFNREPPFSHDAFNDNTDVRTFDTVGRFVYARITTRF